MRKTAEFENKSLEVSVDHVEDASLSDGNDGIIVYVKVENKTDDIVKVKMNSEALIITEKNEQRKSDAHLTGYNTKKVHLKPYTNFIYSYIFFEDKCGELSRNCRLFFNVLDASNGLYYDVEFEPNPSDIVWCTSNWNLCNISIERKITSKKHLKQKLQNSIERIEALEHKMNVRFDSISVQIGDNEVDIYLDVCSNNGIGIEESFYVVMVLYDEYNNILYVDRKSIDKDDFLGLTTLDFWFSLEDGIKIKDIEKIRLYIDK